MSPKESKPENVSLKRAYTSKLISNNNVDVYTLSPHPSPHQRQAQNAEETNNTHASPSS